MKKFFRTFGSGILGGIAAAGFAFLMWHIVENHTNEYVLSVFIMGGIFGTFFNQYFLKKNKD